MIETGLIRAVRARQANEDQLAEFVELLLDALAIPEVAAAVAAALPKQLPRPAPPTGRGSRVRR